jgi:hypothetical protein
MKKSVRRPPQKAAATMWSPGAKLNGADLYVATNFG